MSTDVSTYSHQEFQGLKQSRLGFLKFFLFATIISFASALLRNPALSGIFEILKFPFLVITISILFWLRPVIRINTSSILIWAFISIVSFSTIFNSLYSDKIISSIGVFVVIGLYFQSILNVNNQEDVFNSLFIWFSCVVVITSSVFVLTPFSFIGGRFAAGFINTNVASGFLAISSVVLSYTVIFERSKIFSIILLGASVLLLLLTKGRGAFIATVIPVLLMLISNWRSSSRQEIAIRLGLIGLAIWLSFRFDISDTTNAAELGLMSYRAFELGARESIIESHMAAFWHSPFIGAGAVVNDAVPYSRTSGESSYTDLLALSGGIGISLILVIVARALWVHWFQCRSRLGFFVLLTTLLLAISEGYFVSIASAVSMMLWGLLAVSPRRRATN